MHTLCFGNLQFPFFRPGLLREYKTEMNAMIDTSMQANNGVLKIRQADRK